MTIPLLKKKSEDLRTDLEKMQDNLNVVWKPLPGTSQELAISCPANEILYCGTRGCGKGLPLDEPVYTESGIKRIGDIKVGDRVCCPDGSISSVIGVFPQGVRPVYEITFSDGAKSLCDDQHIWAIHTQDGNKPTVEAEYGYRLMTMTDLYAKFKKGGARLHVPTLDALNMRQKSSAVNKLPVDPYLLGLLLGDGSFTQHGRYCTVDDELCDYVVEAGLVRQSDDKRNGLMCFSIPTEMRDAIKKLKLWELLSHEKFVPEKYLHHSKENRLLLLQGLMDTDGTIGKDGASTSFTSTSEELAKGVQYLARSLGATATLTTKVTTGLLAYNVYIQDGGKFIPFQLKRKADRYVPYMHKKLWRRIVSIKEVAPRETVCIKISHPLGLFITRDFVVTHNTDVQIMAFAKHVGRGYGRFWRGIIFDREYKNLDDLVSRTKRWFKEIYGSNATFLASKSEYKWVWKTGEELLIRTMKHEEDYDDYHGQEFPFIGWNELTKYPNKNCYESMLSCNRSSFTPDKDAPKDKSGRPLIGEIPLVVFSTTNPYGAGRGWVKKRFIDGFNYGQLNRRTSMIFNPREQKEMPYTSVRVALFGHYKENIYLPPQYIATLGDMTNKHKRAAWLEGRWDVAAGGAFEECWDEDIHVLNNFTVPSGWKVFPTFDWGSSAPFAVTWWALTNGEEAYVPVGDGTFYIFSPPANTLVLVQTWYGSDGDGGGLRLGATEVALGMKKYVKEMYEKFYVMEDVEFENGSADGQIFNKINENDPTIAEWFEKEGITWERADKSQGSRVNGLALLQERMLASVKANGRPALYVMRRNAEWVDKVTTLPTDPKNPDDVDTEAEDHLYDATRYAVLRVSNTDTAVIKVSMPC